MWLEREAWVSSALQKGATPDFAGYLALRLDEDS
jgi:hypothetical protein